MGPKQVTHSVPPAWKYVEYPSKRIRNSDESLFDLIAVDHFLILNADGSVARDLITLGASQQLAWHRTEPMLIYFILGNQLRQMNVATGAQAVVWTFDEYESITGRGKSDLSEDGSHFVFEGTTNGATEIFVYDCAKNIKGAVFNSTGKGVNNLYITPENNVVVSYFAAGSGRYHGVELFDSSMVFQRQLVNANGHLAICRDADGSEIMLWPNSDENPVTLPDFPNGIIKVRLSDAKQIGLLALGWAASGPDSMAVDIAADSKLGCLVSAYGNSSTVKYSNQIVLVPFDPAQPPQVVCSTMTRAISYNSQPRAAFASASTVVFGSNRGQISDPNTCDVFMVKLAEMPTPTPEPPIDYSPYVDKSTFEIRPQLPCPTCGSTIKGIYEVKR